MQSVGQASTQSSSFVQVSTMTYAMIAISVRVSCAAPTFRTRAVGPSSTPMYKVHDHPGGDAGHWSVVSRGTSFGGFGGRPVTWQHEKRRPRSYDLCCNFRNLPASCPPGSLSRPPV